MYFGGVGSGEIVSVNIDVVVMMYMFKWFELLILLKMGIVMLSCVGMMIIGKVVYLLIGMLLIVEQMCCVFVFMLGIGIVLDGLIYLMVVDFNQVNLLMLLVGMGVVGGGIFGVMVQYDGLMISVIGFFVFQNVGQVFNCYFDFYLFFGFVNMMIDFMKLLGMYNVLFYYFVLLGNYVMKGINFSEMFDVNGVCMLSGLGGCQIIGDLWKMSVNGGYFDSIQVLQILL